MAFSVFVSHSMRPHDVPLLRGVCDHLSHHGITYYLAHRDWRFGDRLPSRVENEMNRSNCVLCFVSHGGEAWDYVNQEVSAAIAAKKPVIPVVEKDADMTGFRSSLEFVVLDRLAPHDGAAKLLARLNQINATDEVRSALCWAVIATAGLLFLGRSPEQT